MVARLKFIISRIKIESKSLSWLVVLLGLLIAWLAKDGISTLIFSGKSFSGRGIPYQVILFIAFTIIILLLIYPLVSVIASNKWVVKTCTLVSQEVGAFVRRMVPDTKLRITISLAIVGLGVIGIFLVNNVATSIDTKNWVYSTHEIVPAMSVIGADFRAGLYLPAKELFVGKTFQQIWANTLNDNAYPPLVTLAGILFLPFEENKGYLIQVLLLILFNIASLTIAAALIHKYIFRRSGMDETVSLLISAFLFISFSFYTFSSYPFLFSIERGNYDIVALFFTLLTLWVFLRHPEKMWIQVILLSIATNLKIYPAILFLLLLRKHGKKLILPTLISNLVLLFVLGPNNLIAFITTLASRSGLDSTSNWIGNHSSYSFARDLVLNVYPTTPNVFTPLWLVCTLLPVLLWGIAAFFLLKEKVNSQTAILYFMVSVPLMDIIPTVSHDYRLVIQFSVAILLIAFIIQKIIQKSKLIDYLQLVLILEIFLFMGRSFSFFSPNDYFFFASKYLWLLGFELLIVLNIVQYRLNDSEAKLTP